ncbi:hypothetical protein OE88DRAFT_399240 [Heliocybe sulcata]|uniref:BTB domain-containing protein n=1 Tax=Heliocybe sulcata TaxID=5364 RepID=A0A5C3MYG5_9AGAM|nr:hypothetical protein OE88DRAFT_399240 [Heliocybe sulcata]
MSAIGSNHSTRSTTDGVYERGEPWFDDGNVILQAESTRFRVYRGALALNSPVFAGSFPRNRGPQVPSSTAVYRLQVQAIDLQHFLKAIFVPGYYQRKLKTDYDATISIIRLSTKYQVEYFRQDIVANLVIAYPSTLAAWDKRSKVEAYPSTVAQRAVDVLRLAREINVRALIPAALYQCCENPLEVILDGIHQPDGGTTRLSPEDEEICILGRERIVEAFRARLFSESQLVSSGPGFLASRHVPCDSARLRWLYKDEVWEMAFGYDWFKPLHTECPILGPGVCPSCQNAFAATFHRTRSFIWENLPGYFGLPEWSILRIELDHILKEK